MGRAPCCDKTKVKRGPWSPEEDIKLKEFIEKNGTGGNWIALPQKAGLKRCGKSCRLRWLNYLRPNIKHGDFSDDEDRIICTLFATIGSRWSIIAAQLPGRTDNDIKNYWNTKLKKKLLGIPASQRKSSQQHIKQHQQQQQQFIFPSSLDNNIVNVATTTNSSSLPSPHLFNGQEVLYQYHQMKEDQRSSTILTFGGREQSCSNSDGLEEMGFENNYIYGGFEVLGGNNQQASLDVYGNYGDIKHVVGHSDDVYSSLNRAKKLRFHFNFAQVCNIQGFWNLSNSMVKCEILPQTCPIVQLSIDSDYRVPNGLRSFSNSVIRRIFHYLRAN